MSISHEQFYKIYDSASQVKVSKLSKKELQLLSKKISQLIARSWLPGGENIRSVLLSNNSEQIETLFKNNGIETDILGAMKFEVDWGSFLGSVEDSLDPNYTFKMIVAYPPKPSEYNLSDSALEEWVNDEDDENNFKPSSPYIPVTW